MDITPETVKNIKSRGFVKCAITPNVYVINENWDVMVSTSSTILGTGRR